jgi:hypothetical protein
LAAIGRGAVVNGMWREEAKAGRLRARGRGLRDAI